MNYWTMEYFTMNVRRYDCDESDPDWVPLNQEVARFKRAKFEIDDEGVMIFLKNEYRLCNRAGRLCY